MEKAFTGGSQATNLWKFLSWIFSTILYVLLLPVVLMECNKLSLYVLIQCKVLPCTHVTKASWPNRLSALHTDYFKNFAKLSQAPTHLVKSWELSVAESSAAHQGRLPVACAPGQICVDSSRTVHVHVCTSCIQITSVNTVCSYLIPPPPAPLGSVTWQVRV